MGRWRSWLSHLSNTQKVLSSNLGRLTFYFCVCSQPCQKSWSDITMTYIFSTRWYIYSVLREYCNSKMHLIKSKSTSKGSQSPPTRRRSIFSSRSSRHSHSPSPTHKRSIFSSNSHESTHTTHDDSSAIGSGLFGRRRSNSSDKESSRGNGFFGLGRNNNIDNDPTIRHARKKVADAEKAEKEADIALNKARERVREAQEHVRLLEQEAIEG